MRLLALALLFAPLASAQSKQDQIIGIGGGRDPLLAGKRTAMLFFNPSLRTRTAFEVAAHDLGSHAVNLQVGGGLWKLEHRDGS